MDLNVPKFRIKDTSPAERRTNVRNPCFLRAEIVAEDGSASVECEAHDISSTGMRLFGLNFSKIPNRALVRIPRRKLEVLVKVVRRAPKELGVVFLDHRL